MESAQRVETETDRPLAPRTATAWLERVAVTAGLWVVLLGFVGAVCALIGAWNPLVAVTVLALTGATSWRIGAALSWDAGAPSRGGTWAAALLVVAVLGITIWTAATHSEQVLPRRDSASYLQATLMLAETGSRPVTIDVESIGGPETLAAEGITLESPAFYGIGSASDPSVQPQFMPGPALWYSLAWWAGGQTGVLIAPALAGGFALLALGLLVGRTVGRWWMAPAVLLVGACFPWLHTSRSTYSEPLAAVSLAAGFLVLTLAAARGEQVRRESPSGEPPGRATATRLALTALVAGVLIGGTTIVRIDALRETMLLVPVAAVLLARGRAWPKSALVGAAVSTAVGFVVAGVMSWRYLGEISGSLLPLVAMVALMSGVSAVLLRRARGGAVIIPAIRRRLPALMAGAVLIVGAGLALRPLVMTVRQDPSDPGAMYVARMQAEQGLPVDGGRTYAEHSVEWLSWWIGPIALVIALLTLAALAYRLVRDWRDTDHEDHRSEIPAWGAVLVVTIGSTLLTLWRPGITPDHPWADRRLLIALPLALVLVVAAAAWASRAVRERVDGPSGRAVAAGAGALVLTAAAIPTALATAPHASERIEAGQWAAVETVCDTLQPGDVVVAVDDWAANQWPQVSRGMCGVPALSTTGALRDDPDRLADTLAELESRVTERGGRLLLVANRSEDRLTVLGAQDIRLVLDQTVEEDMRILTERPDGTTDLRMQVWTGRVDDALSHRLQPR